MRTPRMLSMFAIALVAAGMSTQPANATASVPSFDHVFVIVMENHSYGEIIGSSSAPYINSLAKAGTLFSDYHAVTHPSLPNYLALTGGSTFGITSDCTTCWVSAANIGDRLEAAGSTWKAYMESMPSPCYAGTSYPYAQKHDPFVYYDDIRTNSARCQAHVVPYSQLGTDLGSAASTPNYAFISPNICNDMHDCSIATGDTWLKDHVPAILASTAFTVQHSLLAITWDEDDSTAANRVPLILYGYGVRAGYVSSGAYNHYSLLHTIEAARGAATLTSNDLNAALITDAFVAVTPCSAVTLAATPADPVTAGAPVTFTAAASGCPNPLYEFWMLPSASSTWQRVQAYSSSATFSWNTTGAPAGTEIFGVWARDTASDVAYDAFTSVPYAVQSAACASVSMTASPASPIAHGSGAQVTLTASAAGCTNPNPLFEFWMLPAGSSVWRVVQTYSGTASWVWNTDGAPAGAERFGVWVRDAAGSRPYDAFYGLDYTLS